MLQHRAFLFFVLLAAVSASATTGADRNGRQIQGRQNAVTTTVTVTDIQYLTSSVNGLCASMVNVTGACRKRRGLWIDNPIFFAFDDDVEEEIEKFFSPTGVFRVETTAAPELRSNNRFNNAFDAKDHGVSSQAVQPSQQQYSPIWSPFYNIQPRVPNPVFFSQIASFIQNLGTPAVTVTETSTSVLTRVTTVTATTKTFIIQDCTPAPFPYTVC